MQFSGRHPALLPGPAAAVLGLQIRTRFPGNDMTSLPIIRRGLLLLLLVGGAVLLAGCSTLHGWAQMGSSGPGSGGASTSIPFGR